MTECYDRIPFLISPLFDDRDQYFYWVTSGWITTTAKERFTCLWYWNYTAPNVELVFQRYLGKTKSTNAKIKDRVLLSYSTPDTVSAFFQWIQKHRDQLLKIHVSEDFLYCLLNWDWLPYYWRSIRFQQAVVSNKPLCKRSKWKHIRWQGHFPQALQLTRPFLDIEGMGTFFRIYFQEQWHSVCLYP